MQLQDLLGGLRRGVAALRENILLREQGAGSGECAGGAADGDRGPQPLQPLLRAVPELRPPSLPTFFPCAPLVSLLP